MSTAAKEFNFGNNNFLLQVINIIPSKLDLKGN